MRIRILKYSYRSADKVIDSKPLLKNEIEQILTKEVDISTLSRPHLNKYFAEQFGAKGWTFQPNVFESEGKPAAKLDFLKDRVGIEVASGHASFIGLELLNFQLASDSGLNTIDLGVYITTTKNFQRLVKRDYNLNWEGSLTFEKAEKYLVHFKSVIQVPIYLIGIDLQE